MNYEERLENVVVIGANGKMGSGIVLLTATEMADLSLKPENKDKQFVLYVYARRQKALSDLMRYIQAQLVKAAEKKIVALRSMYADRADLIENGEMIDQYVKDVMNVIRPITTIESAYESKIVFEATAEDPELKIKLFSQIKTNSKADPWFFTNTSSIPISYLNKEAKLDGCILGVHFYNPPVVQKLVEVIKPEKSKPELSEFITMFIKKLRKVEVPSNDFAGFIGNGHFMRDALHGMSVVDGLLKEKSFPEAVYIVNKVTQDLLIRPMGIFQLIDYVGVDVCQFIMKVMNSYAKNETIHSPLLDKFMEMGVKGGQNFDGSQKDGFIKYEKGRPTGIYDPETRKYIAIDELAKKCDSYIGAFPSKYAPWKEVVGNPAKNDMLTAYFSEMKGMKTVGAKMAVEYQKRSKEIGLKLVEDKVAFKVEDVNTVLLTGFFHAYGPVNDYI